MIDCFTGIINLYDHLKSQVSVGPGGPLHQVGTPDPPLRSLSTIINLIAL